jgi:DNA-binding transcriptional regulator/RsmH inhibitor MraZ
LGWNSTTLIPLKIEHQDAVSINFLLNGTNKFTIDPSGRFTVPNVNSTFPTDFVSIDTGDDFPIIIDVDLTNTAFQDIKVGFFAEINNSGNTQRGIIGSALGFPFTNPVNNVGIFTSCIGPMGSGDRRAIRGQALNNCNNGSQLAALFDGEVFTTVTPAGPSDINLKQNISVINADDLAKLQSIFPKTYYYDPSIEVMNLPSELQYGVLAQNVDSLFPSFTREINHPSDWDNEENVIIHESMDYLGVAYSQFIGLLVAGWQEQNELIETQISEIADLNNEVDQLEGLILAKANSAKLNKSDVVAEFMIYPNPAEDILNAEVVFKKVQNASISLYDINMRKVDTFIPNTLIKGENQYQFNLSNHPSGYYFVVLQTDDEKFVLKLKH